MAARMGSIRYSFAEKRERLLSSKGYSVLGFANIEELQGGPRNRSKYEAFKDNVAGFWRTVKDVAFKGYEMGRKDPRKIVFSAKVGLALMLISLLIFMKEPIKELSQHYVWAILTVVVIFEFSIGATLSKGLNRGIGTLSAGGLALGIAELSRLAGEWEEEVIVFSIFSAGFYFTTTVVYYHFDPDYAYHLSP
ncbi:hypothetical protein Tsubulata_047919, partial [Turnera subulata]